MQQARSLVNAQEEAFLCWEAGKSGEVSRNSVDTALISVRVSGQTWVLAVGSDPVPLSTSASFSISAAA